MRRAVTPRRISQSGSSIVRESCKREIWFKSPVVSMMHDMVITDRHIILPTTGMTTSLERLHAGKIHWTYDKDLPCHVAIIPGDGEARDVRWFRGTPQQAMLLHAINARTEGNRVIVDAPVGWGNFHPFFPNLDGSPYAVDSAAQTLRRWTFDLGAPGDTWQEEILFGGLKCTTMVRMDDRYLTRPFRYSYMLMLDRDVPFDRARGGNLAVRVANAWYRFDHATGSTTVSLPAPRTACPSRSSCRAARMRRKATASWSAWSTTSPRCARSW